MSDAKISELKSVNKLNDNNIIVVVTGYGLQNSYPENVKTTIDRIRKDIVRLNEMIIFVSGYSGYYNSGENIYAVTSHHKEGNLIKLDYEEEYPYIQITSTTGLNSLAGNNIEIQFTSGSYASNLYGGTGPPYYSGIISTTGINARAGTGIYLKTIDQWPYTNEINTLTKTYEKYDTSYVIPTGSSSVDERLMFPALFPSGVDSLEYTKWKCEGYYQNITINSVLPLTYPTGKAPNGETITWNTYSVTDISQGFLKPRLFTYQKSLETPITHEYTDVLYDYTDATIHTNHHTVGTKSHSAENVYFLSFLEKSIAPNPINTQPSGCVGFRLSAPWYSPPSCTLIHFGTYPTGGYPDATISESINVIGYFSSVIVYGHRFLNVAAV